MDGAAAIRPGETTRPVKMNPRSCSLTRSRNHCVRLGADHREDGHGGYLFTLASPDVLERQGFQVSLAVAARLIGLAGS